MICCPAIRTKSERSAPPAGDPRVAKGVPCRLDGPEPRRAAYQPIAASVGVAPPSLNTAADSALLPRRSS